MSAASSFEHWIVLPHLRVQNANSISSPLTHGFPSITAFLGLAWALQRRLAADELDIGISAIGVVCHGFEEQVSDDPYVKSLRLTRNPVNKSGDTAAIAERGRIHLDVSLILAVSSERWNREPSVRDADVALVADRIAGMRIAGGSVVPAEGLRRRRHQPWHVDFTGDTADRESAFRRTRSRLLPGFALVLRDDRLDERHAEIDPSRSPETRLAAWLSLCRINWRWQAGSSSSGGQWVDDRKGRGWLVPIPIGYGALGELHPPGQVANTRDTTTPFRFVESLWSIGEWISPHRLRQPTDLLWYQEYRAELGAYRCRNDYAAASEEAASLFDFD